VDIEEFPDKITGFRRSAFEGTFAYREYVVENLTVEECALDFVRILDSVR
jgi:hypothetical protein